MPFLQRPLKFPPSFMLGLDCNSEGIRPPRGLPLCPLGFRPPQACRAFTEAYASHPLLDGLSSDPMDACLKAQRHEVHSLASSLMLSRAQTPISSPYLECCPLPQSQDLNNARSSWCNRLVACIVCRSFSRGPLHGSPRGPQCQTTMQTPSRYYLTRL